MYSYNSRRYVGLYDVGAGREVRHADTLDELGNVSLNTDEAQWTAGVPRVVAKSDAPGGLADAGSAIELDRVLAGPQKRCVRHAGDELSDLAIRD